MKKATLICIIFVLLAGACTPPLVTPGPTPPASPAPGLTPTAAATQTVSAAAPVQWWERAVFYEIFVRSFYDSDGDGVGDFNGLTEKLDYLNDGDPATTADLGVQALWLMPIFPSPSYHGYDVSDYYTVNPQYGSLDDFRRLLQEAHARGIRVIIDLPVNHTSSQIAWFQEALDPGSPYRDWYIWSQEEPQVIGPWGQDVWHPSPGGYYYGIFDSHMPDLNYADPAVQEEIARVVRFWLEDVQVDGFRLDGARYYVEAGEVMADTPGNHEWLAELRGVIKESNPEALIVGEVWTVSFTVASYLEGDELDLAFDFDRASAMLSSAGSGRSSSAMSQLMLSTGKIPARRYASFLTNHDQDRVMSEMGEKAEKARLAAGLLLTGPSVPFIYYGEEIGMTGSGSHEAVRTPMQWCAQPSCFTGGQPWAAIPGQTAQFNVAAEEPDPASLLNLYRSLVHLRNAHPALQGAGEALEVKADSSAVYSMLRVSEAETLLVLINLGAKPVEGVTLSMRKGPLSGKYTLETLLGEGLAAADLQATGDGGIADYRPLPGLPAGAIAVFRLAPQ